jgi:hypothetical protein
MFEHTMITTLESIIRSRKVGVNRDVAILSAIPKRFKLLVYRGVYNDLKNLTSINQHGFMKNRSTITKIFEYLCIFRAELRTAIRLITSIWIFQRHLIVCVINCSC